MYIPRGWLLISSPVWLCYKETTVNPQNNHGNWYFQYTLVLTQHHENIKNHQDKHSYIKPFIDIYNWGGINYITFASASKKSEKKKNLDIELNALLMWILMYFILMRLC